MGNKIQRIYVGDHYLIYPKRKPSSLTVLYVPLKEDLLDHSPNNVSITNSGSVTISNGVGVFSGSNYLYTKSLPTVTYSNCTMSVRFKNTNSTAAERTVMHQFRYYSGAYKGYSLGLRSDGKVMVQNTYTGSVPTADLPLCETNKWYNVILVRDNPSRAYINGVYYATDTNNNNPELYSWLGIGGGMWYNSTTGEYKRKGNISNVILENRRWTAQEAKDYYDSTKAYYENI